MKQHITIDQLNELSDKGKEKLRKWWKPDIRDWRMVTCIGTKHFEFKYENFMKPEDEANKDYIKWIKNNGLPLLSIGQMIEYLKKECIKYPDKFYKMDNQVYSLMLAMSDIRKINVIDWQGELCDSLWEAVKENLEK